MKLSTATLATRIAAASSYLTLKPRRNQPAVKQASNAWAAAASHHSPRRTAKLCNTFYLTMPADEALVALKNLTLERFSLEFVTIPATGGCVVAVFAPTIPEPDFVSRFRIARQQHDVVRLLTSLGATAV